MDMLSTGTDHDPVSQWFAVPLLTTAGGGP
jgi:hypothetical protein